MTNGVIVQSEDLLLVSVQLNHRSALILVPLKNTAHLGWQEKLHKCLKNKRGYASMLMIVCLPVLSALPGQPWWFHCHFWGWSFQACPASHLTGTHTGHFRIAAQGLFNIIKRNMEKSKNTWDWDASATHRLRFVPLRFDTRKTLAWGRPPPASMGMKRLSVWKERWRWDRYCKSLQSLVVFQYLCVVVSASFEISVYKSNLQISLKPRWRSWSFLGLFLWMLFSRHRNTDFKHMLLFRLKLKLSSTNTDSFDACEACSRCI